MPRMQLSEDEAKLIEARRKERREYAEVFNVAIDKVAAIVQRKVEQLEESDSYRECAREIARELAFLRITV